MFLSVVLLSQVSFAQLSIIPRPAEVVMPAAAGNFTLTPQTVLVIGHASLKPSADFLNDYLSQVYGFTLKTSKKPVASNAVFLQAKNDGSKSGAYAMEVKNGNIAIEGADATGVFYGMQTLLQLLPVEKATALQVPFVSIKDEPRYQYRGMHLDVGRHFYPVEFVKKYIDYVALHKLNYLHWHLTEDQGWRIEIKKYPKLTQVGGWRNGTIIGNYPGTGNDNKRYGGYYTQKEIKDIVAYAAKRYITVVPEIEMPGHASAAIAAFPFLSCFPEETTKIHKNPSLASQQNSGKHVQETWGVFDDVFCAGNDSVFTLLEDVIDEVVALFPSKYIHIGGDECPKTHWKKCAKCQQRIKDNNLKDEHELQSYFIQRMEKYINSKGRTIIGWDEILEGGLAPNAVVMSWRGEAGGIEAAKQRHDVIMTPNSHLYFDYLQGKASMEPYGIGGYLPLERVYSYNPTPAALTPEEAKHIKGVQANLWTEYIPTTEKVEYMAMPRMAALAEVAWTKPELKDWSDFKRRMEQQYQRYDAKNINYAKSAYHVQQTIVLESAPSKATVSFATDSHEPKIYYTLDGTEPTTNSRLYTKPFDIRRSATIKAATFKDGKQMGKTSVQQVVL